MKLTHDMLREMILEEMNKVRSKKVMQEGTYERPIQLTVENLNRIIREEYEAHSLRQSIAESRR
tara:strand:+ start:785 stop:976 length:192 start_codon:yes stop_codon:yes gene_type:complete